MAVSPTSASSSASRSIFVTVGTTRFDRLVDAVTRAEALEWMVKNGYKKLVVQYGTGQEPQIPPTCSLLSCHCFKFTPSLEQDMKQADLIISHAGAGTVMEALKLQKRLVVVINTDLMDNHQTELAHAMASRGHLFVVNKASDLEDMTIWNDLDAFVPIRHEGGDDNDFPRLLNAHMGVG
jgi:beta-1,4-N-acetylglucosaminyltransferase